MDWPEPLHGWRFLFGLRFKPTGELGLHFDFHGYHNVLSGIRDFRLGPHCMFFKLKDRLGVELGVKLQDVPASS